MTPDSAPLDHVPEYPEPRVSPKALRSIAVAFVVAALIGLAVLARVA